MWLACAVVVVTLCLSIIVCVSRGRGIQYDIVEQLNSSRSNLYLFQLQVRWEGQLYEQGVGGKLVDGGPTTKKVNGRGEMESAEWEAVPGICKTFDGWRTELKYGNRKVHLGFFPNIRRASAAYQRAKAYYFGVYLGDKVSGTTISSSSTLFKDENPLLGSLGKAAVPYSSVSDGPLSEDGENIQGGGSQKDRDNDENLGANSVSDCTSQPVDQPPIKRRIVQIIGMEAAMEFDKLKERMSDEELKALIRRERGMSGLYCEPAIGPLHQVDIESIPPCMDGGKESGGVSYNDDGVLLLCGGPEELFVKVWDPEKGSKPDIVRFLESQPPVQALRAMDAANEAGYRVRAAEKAFSSAVEHSGKVYSLPNPPSSCTCEETEKETANHYENKIGPSSCSHQPSLSCIMCHVGTAEEREKREGGINVMVKGKSGEGNNRCERNENVPRILRTRSATLPSQVHSGEKLSLSVKPETSVKNPLDSAAIENICDESIIVKMGNAAADADAQGLRLHDVQKALSLFRHHGRNFHAITAELGWPATTTVSFYYNIWKKSPVYQWWKATRWPVDAVLTRTGMMLQNGVSKGHNDTIALRWRGSRLRTLIEQSNKMI